MSNRKLTWRHLKALHQLYVSKRTEAKITDNAYIENVLMVQKKIIKYKAGNIKILEANPGFTAFYQQYFEADYLRYETFLREQNLESDARRRYTEDDIQTLMFIAGQKEELVQNLSTLRTFSSEIFKGQGSKYLEKKPGLKDAVCKILGIADFPEKDPKTLQWRFVVDTLNPQIVVLCENIAHLKNPWNAREHNIELWYVGGNNIGIIDFIDPGKLRLPIYYCCDWDFDGLSIYSRIKEKMKYKQHDLNLLIPNTYEVSLPIDSPHHSSRWDFNKRLSGLKQEDFSNEAIDLIERLIQDNKWIEEESLDLLGLLRITN
ncbi:toprim domain-containing protein [Anditalea andensis]|uniref:Wadjet protein JetD C-terminal domain-containing protein n=1 Tax=Anditalea andensis TaxID=1048983 RepID=A0A074LIS2_9BACT|nr:hypothetical protein [Anditalea andensis]KEO73672.1 hypothetical protein EL17_11065 [Anditalea andensis]